MIRSLVFISVLLTVSWNAFCQQDNSFRIEKGMLVWQKKYENHSSSDIIILFKDSGLLSGITASENKITGIMKPFTTDLIGSGYSEKQVPVYITACKISGIMTVEASGHNYIVTIRNIKLIAANKNGREEKKNIEVYAIRGSSEMDPEFSKIPRTIYNHSFEKRLGVVTIEDKL